jgi:Putative zinc-finger
MNCDEVRRWLPGYLDGATRGQKHARVREHLDDCERCRQELEEYRLLAVRFANMERVPAPSGLAMRIRLSAARARSPWFRVHQLWQRALLISQNLLEPLAVPATGGVLTALGVFVLAVQSMLVGVPLSGAVPNDLPLNLVQPAQLESLAPFPVAGVTDADGRSSSAGLLLEATLNAQGQVLFYRILAGPNSTDVQHQIDEVLLFSRFRPQMNFGRPMDGGRVFLSFSSIHVRG